MNSPFLGALLLVIKYIIGLLVFIPAVSMKKPRPIDAYSELFTLGLFFSFGLALITFIQKDCAGATIGWIDFIPFFLSLVGKCAFMSRVEGWSREEERENALLKEVEGDVDKKKHLKSWNLETWINLLGHMR